MVILNKMILTKRFTEFVGEFVKIRNEELEDQTKWDFFLHKVYDMTFKEFLAKTEESTQTAETIPDEVLQATVKNSMEILNGFCPA